MRHFAFAVVSHFICVLGIFCVEVATVTLFGLRNHASSTCAILRGVASAKLTLVQSSLIFNDLGGRCQIRWIVSCLAKCLFALTFILIIQSWHAVGIRGWDATEALSDVFRKFIVQTEEDVVVLTELLPLVRLWALVLEHT